MVSKDCRSFHNYIDANTLFDSQLKQFKLWHKPIINIKYLDLIAAAGLLVLAAEFGKT